METRKHTITIVAKRQKGRRSLAPEVAQEYNRLQQEGMHHERQDEKYNI